MVTPGALNKQWIIARPLHRTGLVSDRMPRRNGASKGLAQKTHLKHLWCLCQPNTLSGQRLLHARVYFMLMRQLDSICCLQSQEPTPIGV